MKTILFRALLCCCAVLASRSSGAEGVVEVTNKKGQMIEAYFHSYTEMAVVIKRAKDQKIFELSKDTLDDATLKLFKEWVAEGGGRSEKWIVDYTSRKTERRSPKEDYDDRIVVLEPKLTVKNPGVSLHTKVAELELLLLGEPVRQSRTIQVLAKQKFDLKSLEPGEELELSVEKLSMEYDDKGYAQYGTKYKGYIIAIHQGEKNDLLFLKTSPDTLKNFSGSQLLNLEVKKIYDRELNPVEKQH